MRYLHLILIIFAILSNTSAGAQSVLGKSGDYLNFDIVKNLIETNGASSVEEFIPLLPESFRRSFVMMKKSRSEQLATPLQPRVIFFGETAQSLIAIGGCVRKSTLANTVEMIDFNEKTARFEFHSIDFNGQRPSYSQLNPQTCFKCHQGSPGELRPNWDQYETWTGAWGEDDDHLSKSDRVLLTKFLSTRMQSERYRHLLFQTDSRFAPFSEEQAPKWAHNHERPNFRLTMLLARWNSKKIARMILERPNGKLNRDLMLIESGVGDKEALLKDKRLLKIVGDNAPAQYLHEDNNRLYTSEPEKLKRFSSWVVPSLGLHAKDWTMEFQPRRDKAPSDYNTGSESISDLVEFQLWQDFLNDHPKVARDYKMPADKLLEYIKYLGRQDMSDGVYERLGWKPASDQPKSVQDALMKSLNRHLSPDCSRFLDWTGLRNALTGWR